MINTFVGYNLIARDIDKSLLQVSKQPTVQRESEYFAKNIVNVKSIDEFLDNDRLYRFAMKAHGLEDMAYAKAFMRKALEGGISDSDSFANKLTDKRYAEFVASFNFAARSDATTTYAPAQKGVVDRYIIEAFKAGVMLDNPVLVAQNKAYLAEVGKVKSVSEFLANDAVYSYAMKAFGLGAHLNDKAMMRDMLEDGVADPNSIANKNENKAFAQFVAAFNFAELGEKATTWRTAIEGTIDKFNRQKLEEDAGVQNEGVRLALYFERKASTIKNAYQLLADPALSKVAFTALGLPASFASADIDKQAAFLESKIDFEELSTEKGFNKFMQRFTALWEIDNGSSSTPNVALLFAQPTEMGVSMNTLMALQGMKF
ncbi:MAG: DUF1217 domain-containing protein [Mesorhizobium sp.]